MIAETARIHAGAQLGNGVVVGEYVTIHENVVIGDGCIIQEHCVLGVKGPRTTEPLILGPGAHIRSHSVIYEHSNIGAGLETGHHVVIRERSHIGENLRIGNFSDIEGDCSIGDFTRFHGYVHLGKGSMVGHFVWIFSLSIATNDPLPPSEISCPVVVDDGAVVCVGALLFPGCHVGKGAFVTAGAHVHGEIQIGAVVSGLEGKVVNHVSRLMHLGEGLRHPWMRHFRSAYPPRVHSRLESLLQEVLATRMTLMHGGHE